MKRRELPITCGEVRPINGAPVAHFQPSLGLSDTLSQPAFPRDAAAILHEEKQALGAAGCVLTCKWGIWTS